MEGEHVYRELQRHLDRQPVGFPASKSGAELRILRRFFTPEQARLALHLDYKPSSPEEVHERAEGSGLSLADVQRLLAAMAAAGAIARVHKGGHESFHLMPLVLGMWEYQLNRLDPELLADMHAYSADRSYGLSFLSTEVSQMRTIPVEKSVTVEHAVTSYDALTEVLDASEGPFSVGDCICRQARRLEGKTCRQTDRLETCMAVGDMARSAIQGAVMREITRDEALAIARLNQADRLVLQPSNTQKIEFVCACCGCCCGMLGTLKSLPKPVDFWATNYQASVEGGLCSSCATCEEICPMGAARLADASGTALINLDRCIGCGNCVVGCPSGALRLVRRSREVVPPVDLQDMYETIMTHKKGRLGRMRLMAQLALKR